MRWLSVAAGWLVYEPEIIDRRHRFICMRINKLQYLLLCYILQHHVLDRRASWRQRGCHLVRWQHRGLVRHDLTKCWWSWRCLVPFFCTAFTLSSSSFSTPVTSAVQIHVFFISINTSTPLFAAYKVHIADQAAFNVTLQYFARLSRHM